MSLGGKYRSNAWLKFINLYICHTRTSHSSCIRFFSCFFFFKVFYVAYPEAICQQLFSCLLVILFYFYFHLFYFIATSIIIYYSAQGGWAGRRKIPGQDKAPPATRAPGHPSAQTMHVHRPLRLLQHLALPEPPTLPYTPAGQPFVSATVHSSTHPVPCARGHRTLLLHLSVLHSSRKSGLASTTNPQNRLQEPPALE